MPFIEHRSSGKTHLSNDRMKSRWDAEWIYSGSHVSIPNFSKREN